MSDSEDTRQVIAEQGRHRFRYVASLPDGVVFTSAYQFFSAAAAIEAGEVRVAAWNADLRAREDQSHWWGWLTPRQYARLFPRGQADMDAFLQRVADGEAAGIPARCEDWETLLRVASICLRP